MREKIKEPILSVSHTLPAPPMARNTGTFNPGTVTKLLSILCDSLISISYDVTNIVLGGGGTCQELEMGRGKHRSLSHSL